MIQSRAESSPGIETEGTSDLVLAPKANPAAGDAQRAAGELDPAILTACARDDQAAWRTLIAHYGRRVYALVRSQSLDPATAEEVTQSVFATVSQHLREERYEERGRFEAWLFRVAGNRARDELRKRKRRGHTVTLDANVHAAALNRNASPDAEVGARLQHAIARLGPEDREIIQLRHHAQMSFKQIAETLAQPVGTCLARHHRALKKLRATLEQHGDHA